MTFRLRAGVASVLSSCLVCCVLKPYPLLPVPQSSQNQASEYVQSVTLMYPQTFSAMQRIVLSIRNKHYDFLGHLAMRRNVFFRATAFGEMGGKFFDLYADEGRVELYENPMRLPVKPLAEGVVGDIKYLFDSKLSPQSYLASHEGHSLFLVDPTDSEHYSEYDFRKEDRLLSSSRSVSGGQLLREVNYEGYAEFEGFPHPLPRKILLKNHRWRYQLEIELLSISPTIRNFDEP